MNTMLKSFKNGLVFGLGFLSVLGIVFAASTSVMVPPVSKKSQNGTVSFNEFNQILGTIRNIYNDNKNKRIGINQSNPQSALDVNGNIRISNMGKCKKLGTKPNGKIFCKQH